VGDKLGKKDHHPKGRLGTVCIALGWQEKPFSIYFLTKINPGNRQNRKEPDGKKKGQKGKTRRSRFFARQN